MSGWTRERCHTACGQWTHRRVRSSQSVCGVPGVNLLSFHEVTWTTKSWLGLQKQRISVVLHTAIAEQIVNELANGEGGRVHGAKCLAVLAGVA